MGLLTKNTKALRFRKSEGKNPVSRVGKAPSRGAREEAKGTQLAVPLRHSLSVTPPASLLDRLPYEILYRIQFKHNQDYALLNLVMVNKRTLEGFEALSPSHVRAFAAKFLHPLNGELSPAACHTLERFQAEAEPQKVLSQCWKRQPSDESRLKLCVERLASTQALDAHVFGYRLFGVNSPHYAVLHETLQSVKLVLSDTQAVGDEQSARARFLTLLGEVYSEQDKAARASTPEEAAEVAAVMFDQHQETVSNMADFSFYRHANAPLHQVETSAFGSGDVELPSSFHKVNVTNPHCLSYLKRVLSTNVRVRHLNDFLIGLIVANGSASDAEMVSFITNVLDLRGEGSQADVVATLRYLYEADRLGLFSRVLHEHLLPELRHSDELWHAVVGGDSKERMQAFVTCLLEGGGKPSSLVLRLLALNRKDSSVAFSG